MLDNIAKRIPIFAKKRFFNYNNNSCFINTQKQKTQPLAEFCIVE